MATARPFCRRRGYELNEGRARLPPSLGLRLGRSLALPDIAARRDHSLPIHDLSSRIPMHRFICVSGVIAILISSLAADWTHFRGSDSTGIGAGDPVPLPFGPKQYLAWRADL